MIDLLLATGAGAVNYSIILDVAVCLFVLIFALVGLSKGFFNCILKIFGTLGAILIAWFTAKPVLTFVNGIVNISAMFAGVVSKYFESLAGVTVEPGQINTAMTAIDGSSLPGVLKTIVKNLVEGNTITEATNLQTLCSTIVGHLIAVVVVGIAMFIIVKVVVALLAKLFDDASSKHNALNGLDKLLGAVFGIAKAALFIIVACIAVKYVCLLPNVNDVVNPVIANSTVTKVVYDLVDNKVTKTLENADWEGIVDSVMDKLAQKDENNNEGGEAPAAQFVITLEQ